jgi:acetate kinase
MRILALNAGSSSLKAAVYELDEPGDDGASPPPGGWESEEVSADGNVETLVSSLQTGVHPLISHERPIDMVGHRIVHGGAELVHSERLTTRVHEAIARVAEIAPMHNMPALAVIDAVTRLLGEAIPQVAVFDTAFHATLAPAVLTYAGPFEWLAEGIRRFGFHGISHRYASHHAAKMLGRSEQPLRIVTCHLGSGCSLAAVRGGQSVDTTMGFTPLDGIPMARRSGAVDPGILLHLLRRGEHTPDSLDRLLNHDAGLAGLSGTNGDMRAVLSERDAGNERARLAFDVYVHHVRGAIAAMAASMHGIDALVFTGGVGEHSPQVRAAVCEALEFLGITIDTTLNTARVDDAIVSVGSSRVPVLVIRAQENWVVAQECFRVASDELS